ncbi:MAG: hypothetical protein KDJ14_14260 [Xanthomonadales bacterium]|nr:hypothetical protein [Xanthomonadales bacterium]
MSDRAIDRRLIRLLTLNRRARDGDIEPRNRLEELKTLQLWQAVRLRGSFTDFLQDPKRQLAAEFFLTDLYGDFDVSGRDRDIERVLPIMRRVLPEKLLGAAADAIELAVLSHLFDLRLAKLMYDMGCESLDDERYGELYRRCGLPRLRQHQIHLIVVLGITLDRAVSVPMIGQLLRLARGPARAAGLGALQSFLERGFAAFKALRGARTFVDEIARREGEVSRRLFEQHPDPFGRRQKL